jgi:hypothetical protein
MLVSKGKNILGRGADSNSVYNFEMYYQTNKTFCIILLSVVYEYLDFSTMQFVQIIILSDKILVFLVLFVICVEVPSYILALQKLSFSNRSIDIFTSWFCITIYNRVQSSAIPRILVESAMFESVISYSQVAGCLFYMYPFLSFCIKSKTRRHICVI